MNFSKLKLNKLAESTHQAYYDAEGRNSKATGQTGSASKALVKQQTRPQRNTQLKSLQTQGNNQRTGQVTKGTPIAGTPTPRSGGYDRKFSEEHFRELRLEQEMTKRLQEKRSDWRSELIESAEAIDKEMHPYVDVMPRADQNVRTLKKQMAGEVVDKVGKDLKQEGYAPGDVDERLGAVTSISKKDQDDAKARLLAKAKAKREKMKKESVQIDEIAPLVGAAAGMLTKGAATAGAAKAGGAVAKAASSKVGQAAISAGSDAVGNKVEKKMSEEVEDLEEAKKKCKSGYKYDKKKKKCVKKKKSSSSSKKSSPTYVFVGRPGYGGGGHHHHHHHGGSGGDNGGDGGDNGGDSNGGGGDAGGGGE